MRLTVKRWLYPKVKNESNVRGFLDQVHDNLSNFLLDLQTRVDAAISNIETSSGETGEQGPSGEDGQDGQDGQDLTLPDPVFVSATNSPKSIIEPAIIIVDMSLGDVTINLGTFTDGYVQVVRIGEDNTLMVYPKAGETIGLESSLEILNDQDCPTMRLVNNDWRIV